MNPAMRNETEYWLGWYRRLLRALGWTLFSGGWLWWRATRICLQVARAAPTFARAEVVLVPGFRLSGDEISLAYVRRLRRARRLYRSGRFLLLSGTTKSGAGRSEALAGHAFLCDLGLPAKARVLLDHRARDTEENMQQAADLIATSAGGSDSVVIVSNRWHLARCAYLARQQGRTWKICAAERRWRPDWLDWLALGREGLALLSVCGPRLLQINPRQLLEITQR